VAALGGLDYRAVLAAFPALGRNMIVFILRNQIGRFGATTCNKTRRDPIWVLPWVGEGRKPPLRCSPIKIGSQMAKAYGAGENDVGNCSYMLGPLVLPHPMRFAYSMKTKDSVKVVFMGT
jgi:hypothetical protein